MPNLYDPQSLNRYSYARNNPLKYTDPTGHFFKSFFKSVGKLLSEPWKIAKEFGHKPLNLLSPLYWTEASYRVHPVLLPFRATGVIDKELDAGQRAIHKFRESRTGRYVDAGVITAGAIVAAAFCGGCTAPAIGPLATGAIIQGAYIGAAVGSASGRAQAAYTGGDPFQASAMGFLIGGAGGAIGAGVGNVVGNTLINPLMGVLRVDVALQAAKFGGSIVGSSVVGGVNSSVNGTNLGKGFAFGALGGAFGGATAQTFSPALDLHLGKSGGLSRRG